MPKPKSPRQMALRLRTETPIVDVDGIERAFYNPPGANSGPRIGKLRRLEDFEKRKKGKYYPRELR